MIEEWKHLIVFKAKPDGGFRPIAQMVSLLRVWGKLRHDVAAEWEIQSQASFFWGVSGKPCDRAGWEHNLYEEAATAQGDNTASLFGDIAKFYDNVSHHHLWREGLAVNFHPRLLLLMLLVYSLPRVITINGAHSEPIPVTGTILPGCSLAATGSKLLMFRLLSAMQISWPLVRTRNIVDDITMQTSGSQQLVVHNIAGATKQLMAGLTGLDLPLSAKKTVFMASSGDTAKLIQTALKPYAIPRKTALRNLGTDTGGGSKRTSATLKNRLKEALRRSARVKQFRDSETSPLELCSYRTHA